MNSTTRIIKTSAELQNYDWKVPVPGAYPSIEKPGPNATRAEHLAYQDKFNQRFEHYKTVFQAYYNISLQGIADAEFDCVQRLFFLIND